MNPLLRIALVIVVNVLAAALIFFLNHQFIQNQDIRDLADLGIGLFTVVFTGYAVILLYEIHHSINQHLLKGLLASQGKTVNYAKLTRNNFEVITLGDTDNSLGFNIRGRVLIDDLTHATVTPILTVEPAVFLNEAEQPGPAQSIWYGDPEKIVVDKDKREWSLTGAVPFKTSKVNGEAVVKLLGKRSHDDAKVTLKLQFMGGGGLLVDCSLDEDVKLERKTKNQIFQSLIDFDALKKLPPGYNLYEISPNVFTNVIFLPEKLQTLKQDDENRNKSLELETSLAFFTYEAFIGLPEHSSANLVEYSGSEPIDKQLNCPDFLKALVSITNDSQRKSLPEKVYVAAYLTSQVIAWLQYGHRIICLFGCESAVPVEFRRQKRVTLVYNLDRLTPHMGRDLDCYIDTPRLKKISENGEELFQKWASELHAYLKPPVAVAPSPKQQQINATNETLPILLQSRLMEPARRSLQKGIFINSEPDTTNYWINLKTFNEYQRGHDTLAQAVTLIIDRLVESYAPEAKRKLYVLNLCSQSSGIADELDVMWPYQYPNNSAIETGTLLSINEHRGDAHLPDILNGTESGDVIVITPIDSYAKVLKIVLDSLDKRNKTIAGIIALFSIAKSWDYLGHSENFGLIPLYKSVSDDHGDEPRLKPLTEMTAYLRSRPYLVK